jgi:hypothetical protein
MLWGSTRWQLADSTGSLVPVEVTILVIATGLQKMPREGRVASAAATPSGETWSAPSVNDGSLSALAACPSLLSGLSSDFPSGQVKPICAAVLTTLHRPTFCSRYANHTLIDSVVPV